MRRKQYRAGIDLHKMAAVKCVYKTSFNVPVSLFEVLHTGFTAAILEV